MIYLLQAIIVIAGFFIVGLCWLAKHLRKSDS
jgi:hypothetical protein